MSEPQRAPGLGAAGGLPGSNAAPAAREPGREELDVVATGGVRTIPVGPIADRDADAGLCAPHSDDEHDVERRVGLRRHFPFDVTFNVDRTGPDRTETGLTGGR